MHILSDEMLISMFDIKVTLFYMPLPRFIRPIELGLATVRPWAAQPQAAGTLKMHVFELGLKELEMQVFAHFYKFFDKWVLEMHIIW